MSALQAKESNESNVPAFPGRKTSMNLRDEDFTRVDALKEAIGRPSTRTETIRRALGLLFWAFITKSGDELVVMKKGKEIGRMRWADVTTAL